MMSVTRWRCVVVLNSIHPHAVRRAALSGLGFARIPRIFIEDDLTGGRLVEVLGDYADEDRTINIVYPHRRHLPTKTRAFVDFMVDWFGKNTLSMEMS